VLLYKIGDHVSLLDTIVAQLTTSFQEFWGGFIGAFIAIILLLIFLVVGYFIAKIVVRIVAEIFKKIKLEKVLKKAGLPEKFGGFTITGILLIFVELFIVLAFLGIATDIPVVNLGIVTDAIVWVIAYIPVLIQGLIVLVVALLFANYVSNIIRESEKLPLANGIAFIVQLFIGYAALVMAIPLILPNADVGILKSAFEWFIAALAIALGLGIGIATGFSLRKPIEKAASKRPGMFDYLMGRVEGSIRKTKRRRR